ncbi:Mu homology domain-containing protein [Lactarius deliciosus]|nr:Mu homology domain-containing protein [Lactarius deliciosus]
MLVDTPLQWPQTRCAILFSLPHQQNTLCHRPIPWCKPGLRYNHSDIYFDIAETLDAVVNKNGTIVTSSVLGKIDVDCRLSGTPDLSLTLTNSHTISEPSFHPCVQFVPT